ncbi:MAG: glycosyltransferase family 1 protein, partial [Dictyoglomaceae bacterium]
LPIKARKRLVTIHDVFHLAFYGVYNYFERNYAKFLVNSAVRLSDKVITVSNFSKQEIIKYTGVKREKITVIYNGVDTNIFKTYDKKDLKSIIFRYNLPEKFILYVGNVKPHKNLKNTLLAFKIVKEEIEDLFLVIVGKKDGFLKRDVEILKLLSKDKELNNKVIFTDYVEKFDISKIYNLASIFIFPSLYEGFGLPPLEAMACGCPVVASDIPVIKEICDDAVYYVNPYNPMEIAKGIISVFQDRNLRERLIEKGLRRVKKFTWEESAKKHLEVILEIMKN